MSPRSALQLAAGTVATVVWIGGIADGWLVRWGYELPGFRDGGRISGRHSEVVLAGPFEKHINVPAGKAIYIDYRVTAEKVGVRMRIWKYGQGDDYIVAHESVLTRNGSLEVPIRAGGTYRVEASPMMHFTGEYDIRFTSK